MGTFKRILIATDFSAASAPAFAKAIAIAKQNDALLLVVHAYEQANLPDLGYAAAAAYSDWDRELRSHAEQSLESLAREAQAQGVNTKTMAIKGFPEEAIVAAASENSAELIVIGTHGRRGAARFFLGSVASRVISSAPCPVLTVRCASEKASV